MPYCTSMQILRSIGCLGIFMLSAEMSHSAQSAIDQTVLIRDHMRVTWVAPRVFGKEPTLMGIYFQPEPGWHIYWKNPGDSGAAPKFKFTAESAEVGPVQWPYPTRLPFGKLTNLGYEGRVVIPFTVTPTGSDVVVRAELEWLVCKEECVPGFGTLTLKRPAQAGKSVWETQPSTLMERFSSRVPAPAEASPWRVTQAERLPGELIVHIEASPPRTPASVQIFPAKGEALLPGEPILEKTAQGYRATFKTSTRIDSTTGEFILVENMNGTPARTSAWTLPEVPVGKPTTGNSAIAWLLLSAFMGGVLLNLMPCVFPVLSIKILSLLHTGHDRRQLARDGALYTAGVITTFAALGGLFLVLRLTGSSIGWGFQLQSPLVVVSMILLFWLMSLNLLGVFEWGTRLMTVAGQYDRGRSAFATGMLSVFIATPCTGPFMGTALAASATLPAVSAMAIFISLGAGLAAPYWILTLNPRTVARLPRAGRWMETLKQLFAFPLFATVLWLLWVLGRQLGDSGWLIGGILLLATSFALWLGRSPRRATRIVAWAFALFAIGWGYWQIHHIPVVSATSAVSSAASLQPSWQPYDASQITAARERGQAVFIDFTAAWCISCQWNKKFVLETQPIAELFTKNKVYLVRADWTHQDPAITRALAEFGRNSVPLYVFYPAAQPSGPADSSAAQQEPQILPPILSSSMIEALF